MPEPYCQVLRNRLYFEIHGKPESFEHQLHKEFAPYRLRGEWYTQAPELMQRLAELSTDCHRLIEREQNTSDEAEHGR